MSNDVNAQEQLQVASADNEAQRKASEEFSDIARLAGLPGSNPLLESYTNQRFANDPSAQEALFSRDKDQGAAWTEFKRRVADEFSSAERQQEEARLRVLARPADWDPIHFDGMSDRQWREYKRDHQTKAELAQAEKDKQASLAAKERDRADYAKKLEERQKREPAPDWWF